MPLEIFWKILEVAKKTKIIFIGAGAIGRGYLPWTLDHDKHDFIFIDTEDFIINSMNLNGGYKTYLVKENRYEEKFVKVQAALSPDQFILNEHLDSVACFLSVGPRNVQSAAKLMKGSEIPLILCENEPETVNVAKNVVGHKSVYFAIPDVITSNTAPEQLLANDPLAITTENGTQFIESGPKDIYGDFKYLEREELLKNQWTPKLYLHNTPHCIAAYLGALIGVKYIHEAMENSRVSEIVESAMNEMLQSLKSKWDISHDFLEWYAEKELLRFKSKLLFDPVSRVAREPLRKLESHGRLIGASQICLTLGVLPHNLIKGIVGALLFEDINDPDHHIGMMRQSMNIEDFNRYVLGLRPGEPLDLMLRSKLNITINELEELRG